MRTDLLFPFFFGFFASLCPTWALEDEPSAPCTADYGVLTETNDLVDLDNNSGCNMLKGEVPYIGHFCVKLLERGPCPDGHWLVIDEDKEVLKCKVPDCPSDKIEFDDDCVSFNDSRMCKPTFILSINEYGKGECSCPPGNLYHERTDRCYVPYTQGPCRRGYIIKRKIDDDGAIGRCRRNPCPQEKMTPLDARCLPKDDLSYAKCFTLGKQKPCKNGSYLLVEPSLARPFCLAHTPNSVVPRIFRRSANYYDRPLWGCNSYRYSGSKCRDDYIYSFNMGIPQCTRCKKKSW